MYINKGILLNFILICKRLFQFLNKHFYIVFIISYLYKLTNNNFYKYVVYIIKLIIFINIIFGVGYFIYLSVLELSIVNGFYLYLHILKGYLTSFNTLCHNYLDIIIDLWNKVEDKSVTPTSSNQDLINQIKQEFKQEFKQVIDEAVDKINEIESDQNVKNICFRYFSSILFLLYYT